MLNLTPREFELLTHLCEGRAGKIAADRMGITLGTVEKYLDSMHDKFDVRTTLEMVCIAFRSGLIPIEKP